MKTQQLSAASRIPLLLIINRPSFFNFFCQKGGRRGSPSLPRASCVQSKGLHRGQAAAASPGQAALLGRSKGRASPPTPVGDRRSSATHPRLPDLSWRLQARQLASAQGGAGATWLPRSTRGPCAQPLRSHSPATLPVRSPRSQTTGRPTPRRDNAAGAAAPLTPSHSPHARAAAARSSSAALRAAVLRVRRAPACAAPGASQPGP